MKEVMAGSGWFSLGGVKSFGVKTVGFLGSPAFGVAALAGVIGWQLWQAKKESDEIRAKKAAAAQ